MGEADQLLPLGEIFGVSSCQDDPLGSKAPSAPKDSEVQKKAQKKDRQNRRKALEESKDSDIFQSLPKIGIKTLPPLKLHANRTRIVELSSPLEQSTEKS